MPVSRCETPRRRRSRRSSTSSATTCGDRIGIGEPVGTARSSGNYRSRGQRSAQRCPRRQRQIPEQPRRTGRKSRSSRSQRRQFPFEAHPSRAKHANRHVPSNRLKRRASIPAARRLSPTVRSRCKTCTCAGGQARFDPRFPCSNEFPAAPERCESTGDRRSARTFRHLIVVQQGV